MKEFMVSIIIPCYNAEKYIDKCLSSIINQTLKRIEIIVVNDGSTDKSLDVITRYQNKFSNIKIVNQKNMGQAESRNKGIRLAKGEYIGFVDSDDYIESGMYETLYNEAKQDNLDLVICNFDRVSEDGKILRTHNQKRFNEKYFNNKQLIYEFFLNENELIEGYCWNKLFKRSLFIENGIFFPKLKYEDIPTVFEVLCLTNRAKYINRSFYHYVQRNTSTVHSTNEQAIKDFIVAINLVNQILVNKGYKQRFKAEFLLYIVRCVLYFYVKNKSIIERNKEIYDQINCWINEISLKKCILSKKMTIRNFIRIILYKIGAFKIFFRLFHLFRPSV
ncbi:glycosyltransferase [Sporolactobacillus sp. Y61]|uniref:Glycosyltransferase n=1 Tax=Sporolactobacillus sp. Y61 TaxID=3160863 RepID=A0AAU8IHX5_9BACL